MFCDLKRGICRRHDIWIVIGAVYYNHVLFFVLPTEHIAEQDHTVYQGRRSHKLSKSKYKNNLAVSTIGHKAILWRQESLPDKIIVKCVCLQDRNRANDRGDNFLSDLITSG